MRGVALWLGMLGLFYLAISLALVDAFHHPPRETDVPWLSLPWGLSEGELLTGATIVALSALASSALLWLLTPLGRITTTIVLVGLAGWALWVISTAEFASGPLAFAAFNTWLASTLWRADMDNLFRRPRVEPWA